MLDNPSWIVAILPRPGTKWKMVKTNTFGVPGLFYFWVGK